MAFVNLYKLSSETILCARYGLAGAVISKSDDRCKRVSEVFHFLLRMVEVCCRFSGIMHLFSDDFLEFLQLDLISQGGLTHKPPLCWLIVVIYFLLG